MAFRQTLRGLFGVLAVSLLIGCAKESPQVSSARKEDARRGSNADAQPAGAEAAGDPEAPKIVRKVIYKATLKVEVENFSSAEEKMQELVDEHHAILEKEEIKGSTGSSRSGYWKIRVPTDDLRAFRTAVLKLGDPLENNLGSEDVTEEYYDLAKRIKSKENELETYRGLYAQAKSTQDAIAVKRELDRAQEQLDRFKGRQNRLRNLSDLTTVEVTLRERGVYLADETPPFGERIGRVFTGSLNGLIALGKFLVLCAVGITPWLPIILGITLPPYFWWRRRRRRRT